MPVLNDWCVRVFNVQQLTIYSLGNLKEQRNLYSHSARGQSCPTQGAEHKTRNSPGVAGWASARHRPLAHRAKPTHWPIEQTTLLVAHTRIMPIQLAGNPKSNPDFPFGPQHCSGSQAHFPHSASQLLSSKLAKG